MKVKTIGVPSNLVRLIKSKTNAYNQEQIGSYTKGQRWLIIVGVHEPGPICAVKCNGVWHRRTMYPFKRDKLPMDSQIAHSYIIYSSVYV